MAYNVISCRKVAENTQILKIAKLVLSHLVVLVEVLVHLYLCRNIFQMVLLHMVFLVEVLVHLYLCLNIFQMVLLHLVVLVEVCAY